MDNDKELIKELFQDLHELSLKQAEIYPQRQNQISYDLDQKLFEFSSFIIEESKKIKEKIPEKFLTITEEFKNYPVFIGGCIKSGTSLINNLLDYHPDLLVLFSDNFVIRSWLSATKRLSKIEYFYKIANFFISRLYNPNFLFPFDLLKGKTEELSLENYIKFAVYLRYFIFQSDKNEDEISSVARAIFAVNGQFERGNKPKMWVEKTPYNGLYFDLIKKIFPRAKFIYISRYPYDNMSSIKRWKLKSGKEYDFFFSLRGMRRSYQKSIINKKIYFNDVLVIRYEDLISNTESSIREICAFLGIGPNEGLNVPTIFGNPRMPNSSHYSVSKKESFKEGIIYKEFINKHKENLSEFEIYCINRKVGKYFNIFDYNLIELELGFIKKIFYSFKMYVGEIITIFKLIRNKVKGFINFKI